MVKGDEPSDACQRQERGGEGHSETSFGDGRVWARSKDTPQEASGVGNSKDSAKADGADGDDLFDSLHAESCLDGGLFRGEAKQRRGSSHGKPGKHRSAGGERHGLEEAAQLADVSGPGANVDLADDQEQGCLEQCVGDQHGDCREH